MKRGEMKRTKYGGNVRVGGRSSLCKRSSKVDNLNEAIFDHDDMVAVGILQYREVIEAWWARPN